MSQSRNATRINIYRSKGQRNSTDSRARDGNSSRDSRKWNRSLRKSSWRVHAEKSRGASSRGRTLRRGDFNALSTIGGQPPSPGSDSAPDINSLSAGQSRRKPFVRGETPRSLGVSKISPTNSEIANGSESSGVFAAYGERIRQHGLYQHSPKLSFHRRSASPADVWGRLVASPSVNFAWFTSRSPRERRYTVESSLHNLSRVIESNEDASAFRFLVGMSIHTLLLLVCICSNSI